MQKKQVDLITIPLTQPDNVINALYWFLTESEKNRLVRFRYSQERNRYIVCHGAVRQILARYLGKPYAMIKVEQTPSGKPYIPKKGGGVEIQFNYSHSEDLAICALSPDLNLGIDIQFIHPFMDLEKLVATYFSEEERLFFESVEKNNSLHQFFTLWTRKEAFVKAIGQGLSFPLKECTVLDGKLTTHFKQVKLGWRTSLLGYWYYCDLNIQEGYACSLVIEAEKTNAMTHQVWQMDFKSG